MRIQFLSLFDECEIINAHEMTSTEIVESIKKNLKIDCNNLCLFFEGNYLTGDVTASHFNATDDDELICFVDHENKSDYISPNSIPLHNYYGITNPLKNANVSRANPSKLSPKDNQKLNLVVESSEDYAKREVLSGKFVFAMNEVNMYPILENLFMNKLRAYNSRLYSIFQSNRNLLLEYISSSVNQSSSEEQAFTLLTEQNRSDIMHICEIMQVDYSEALVSYINNDMNLETWSQNSFP